MNYSFIEIYNLIKSNIKVFAIVGIVAIILSSVFSSPYFIQPKYKSSASVYPSNLVKYSGESESEQLLSLFKGNDIRDSIIAKFNLVEHYKLDTGSRYFNFELNKQYANNVKISKNRFESVEVEVLDENPLIAKQIADELINQVNLKIRNLHKIKAQEIVEIKLNQLNNKGSQIDSLTVLIKEYSVKYGLLDYIMQSKEVTKGYMNILNTGKKGNGYDKTVELYHNIQKQGRYFHDLHHQLNLAREEYNKILIAYENAKRDVVKKLTYTNTIVFPEVSDKKVYPIRWLIVLGSTLSTLFLVLIYLVFTKASKINA